MAPSEKLVCEACGKSAFTRTLRKTENYNVQQCKECGLGMTMSFSPALLSADFYGKDYFTKTDGPGSCFFTEFWNQYDKARFNEELDLLEKFISQGRILDVGCATGNFLCYAKERGWQVYGYDVSEFAVRCTRERTNANVATGLLGPGVFPDGFFDVITLHHVLEHIENPRVFLSDTVWPLLKRDGIVLIEVPNLASLEARTLRGEWEDLRTEQHRWHFTPKSLKLLLKDVGGRDLWIRTRNNPLWRIRMLPDHLWMFLALLPLVPYRGVIGRSVANSEAGYPCFGLKGNKSIMRSWLWKVFRIIDIQLMRIINWAKLGKRIVVIARKDG